MSDHLLNAEVVEQLADALADRLDARRIEREGWVTAEVVSHHLNVEVGFVYEHAGMLGGVRLGEGSKGRLRFRLADVDAALSCVATRGTPDAQTGAVKPRPPRRRRTSLGTNPPLLPIHGSPGAGRERRRGRAT